jgi:hypothetical protein
VLLPWVFIALGSVLRVFWPLDFEWKQDEKWMFERALRIADGTEQWPWIGMSSGAGLQNPGASIWPFAVLAHVTRDPATMTFAIMLLNVLALWGFAWWVQKTWAPENRERGLWGIALFAVSLLPVLFSRKIWAQDILPVLLVPWLWAHANRSRFAPAFFWGVIGAFLGQIHMSGFFAAATLVLATFVFDRKRTNWLGWFAGSGLAALPLLPWIKFTASPQANHISSEYTPSLAFFWYAGLNAFGLDARYSLKHHFAQFLRGPMIFGVQTHALYVVHFALAALALYAAWIAIRTRVWSTLPTNLRIHALSFTACGVMMHGLGVLVHPHYLIVFSPLLHVFTAWVLAARPRALCLVVALQLFVTIAFMCFIHWNGGAPRGDYGTAYRAQTPEQRALLGIP